MVKIFMNGELFKRYRFGNGKFVKSNTCFYSFSIGENDGFYDRMRKFIEAKKVEGQTSVRIDAISVEDEKSTFFDTKSYTMKANIFATDDENNVVGYLISIRNIKLVASSCSEKKYINGSWQLNAYSLEIPYQTTIDVKRMDN